MRPLVLIAEDEPYIAESLTFLLERAGLAAEVAGDGTAALEAVRSHKPAVVILDVMLPKGGGLEVLKAVKMDPELAAVRILVLTARGRENDRQTAIALGADAYITKPFSNRDVVMQTCALAGVVPAALADAEPGDGAEP
ncbi:MAG: response regulator transcription factor [Kiloniellales bacterium]